jgi:hypothetical protein
MKDEVPDYIKEQIPKEQWDHYEEHGNIMHVCEDCNEERKAQVKHNYNMDVDLGKQVKILSKICELIDSIIYLPFKKTGMFRGTYFGHKKEVLKQRIEDLFMCHNCRGRNHPAGEYGCSGCKLSWIRYESELPDDPNRDMDEWF